MRKPIRIALAEPPKAYPSLGEHLASRRRFLEVAGASLAAGGLSAACGRGIGGKTADAGSNPDSQPPDAQVADPDGTIVSPGVAPNPDYFQLRIPATGETAAYLVDGGYCTFYVEVATYNEASYLALLDHPAQAEERCRTTISDFTYDTLNTASGLQSAEDDLTDTLDGLCQELNQHTLLTLEAVTLTITYLEDDTPLDGGMPEPEYP